MTFSPGILGLMKVSVLLAFCALYAAGARLRLLAGWDAGSPSQAQLLRERKTSLLSSVLGVILIVQWLCGLLFLALADRLQGFFTGAMCAASTLNVNAYANPALLTMLAGFVLCARWLVNHLDKLAQDFALIRLKREYRCAGYLIYGGLLLGTTLGTGAGLVSCSGNREALREVAPKVARRLKFCSVAGYALLGLMSTRPMNSYDFRL